MLARDHKIPARVYAAMSLINDLRADPTRMHGRALRSLRRLLMVRLPEVIRRIESSGPMSCFRVGPRKTYLDTYPRSY